MLTSKVHHVYRTQPVVSFQRNELDKSVRKSEAMSLFPWKVLNRRKSGYFRFVGSRMFLTAKIIRAAEEAGSTLVVEANDEPSERLCMDDVLSLKTILLAFATLRFYFACRFFQMFVSDVSICLMVGCLTWVLSCYFEVILNIKADVWTSNNHPVIPSTMLCNAQQMTMSY